MVFRNTIKILILVMGFSACSNENSTDTGYQEKLITIEQTERSQPTRFLKADATYNQNLFGDKLKLDGTIKNNATVATYKDVVVKVTYFNEAKAALRSNEYTINDFFPPNSEKPFDLKIENYKDVNTIGWEVLTATPQ